MFAKTKADLKALNSRMNTAKKRISHIEDRIMKTSKSRKQTESQMKKKKKKKSNKKELKEKKKKKNESNIKDL